MKNCLLIINPCSGKLKIQNELLDIVKILNENNYCVEVQITLYHNHAREIASKIINKDIVICSGGDGTLNQVVSGMMEGNINIPLGYIPSGSTNDYANTLGLSFNAKDAIKNIINGSEHLIDVGKFGDGEFFNYVASFGLFTAASYSTPQSAKNVFGNLAYLFSGIADLANIKPRHIRGLVNETLFEDDYILGLILNTTSVGGIVKMNNIDVDLSDGLFEVVLVKNPKDFSEQNRIVQGFLNCDFTDSVFTFAKTNKIEFYLNEPMSWSLDGEEKKTNEYIKIQNIQRRIKLIK